MLKKADSYHFIIMHQINRIEWIGFSFVFLLIILGLALSYLDSAYFRYVYTEEDGFIEWLTVFGLLIGMLICLRRVVVLFHVRPPLFLLLTLLLGLAFLFGAGEEISWGQRILDRESSEFFQQYNVQGETNLHNLLIGGVKMNKLIFAKGALVVMLIYWFVITPLYKRKPGFARLVDSLAVPIPQNHHIIAYIVGLLVVETLVDSPKRGELTELAVAFLFPLNMAFPYNAHIFDPGSGLARASS